MNVLNPPQLRTKKLLRPLKAALIISVFSLTGCTFDASLWNLIPTASDTVAGKVEVPLTQANGQSNNSCKIKMYQLDTHGQKSTFIAETSVDAVTGEYSFSSSPKDVQESAIQTKYSLEYICGNNFLQRFVTGFEKQNLNFGTTLLSWISYSQAKDNVTEIPADSWEKMYKGLATASDLPSAYALLEDNSTSKVSFSSNFQITPDQLKLASPQIISMSAPKNLHELGSASVSAVVVHWSNAYPLAINWKLNDDLISKTKDFTFVANKNQQGTRTIKILAGTDDGSGNVDVTKFHMLQESTVTISNDYPAVVPNLTRTSALYTNSQTVSLSLDTGTNSSGVFTNCATFSNLALIEEGQLTPSTAPSLNSSYNKVCNTANPELLTFNLAGTEGTRYLKLWSKDSSGNISATPNTVSVVYDVTSPAFQILSLSGGQAIAPDEDTDITWTTTELNPSTMNLEYTLDDGANWVAIASNVTDSGSYTWHTPNTVTSLARVRLTMTDLAGNLGTAQSATTFSINSLKPSPPVIALASAAITNNRTITVDVTCDPAFSRVYFSESTTPPVSTNPNWQLCANQLSTTITTGDAVKTVYAWSKDLSGRISDTTTQLTVTLDQTAPTVTLTSHNSGQYSSRVAQNVTWTSSDLHLGSTPVSLSYSESGGTFNDIVTGRVGSGTYSWAASNIDNSAVRLRATACDVAGNCSTDDSNSDVLFDGVAPTITFTQLNSGASITANSYVNVSFTANDSRTGVTKYCFIPTLALFAPSKPAANNSCWNNVTLATTVNLTRTAYLGLDEGLFTIYVWAMDATGNISDISSPSVAEKDNDVISYGIPKPPTLKNASASLSNSNVFPPASSDLFVPNLTPIYVKWRLEPDADVTLAANPITIQYSTDGVNFDDVTNGVGLVDGVNGSCSIDGTIFTGCFRIPTSNGGPYQFKIVAKTQSTITSSVLTPIINLSNQADPYTFKIIAGNVSRSLKENALSSIVMPNVLHSQSMAMDSKGVLYLFNYKQGIVKLDPNKGILEPILTATGTTSGNGGHHLLATMTNRAKIDVDGFDRLVIWDDAQIRRIDFTDGIITNIVGPGSSNGTGVTATSYQVPVVDPGGTGNILRHNFFFKALPNGDVVFRAGKINYNNGLSNRGGQIARYQNSDGKILEKNISVNIPGFGDNTTVKMLSFQIAFDPNTYEISFIRGAACPHAAGNDLNCTGTTKTVFVDPTTFQITETVTQQETRYPMTTPLGQMLAFSERQVFRYDMTAKEWIATPILGTAAAGFCVDTIPDVSTCDMDIRDAFVTPFGQLYVWDGNLIRVVTSNNKFKTLAGQRLSSGDGGAALSSRIAAITSFDIRSTPTATRLVFNEISEYKVREINLDGSNLITHIAGNGKNGDTVTAGVKVLNLPGTIQNVSIKPDTNEVYVVRRGRVYKINSSQEWEQMALGGATSYSLAGSNGLAGLSVGGANNNNTILLYLSDTRAIMSFWTFGNPNSTSFLKMFDTSDLWRTYNLGGGSIVGGDVYSINQTGSYSQPFIGGGGARVSNMTYDATANEFLFLSSRVADQKFITRYVAHNSNSDYDLNDAGDVYSNYTLQHNSVSFASVRNANVELVIYYCATDGIVYKQNITLATAPRALTSNFTSIKCDGTKMRLDKNRRSVIFPFTQNDLWGFAEVVDTVDIPPP